MNMQPVESSNIIETGHDPGSNTMRVKFRSGKTYAYPGVTAEQHEALRSAESIGSHFHHHIKSKHAGVLVP